jgi:uracil-DNA glycosylase
MPDPIPNLLAILEDYPDTRTVANPYRHELQRKNLRAYFEALIRWPCSGDLLVGEAPGYAGCALTGIPFTSEAVIQNSRHPFICRLHPHLRIAGIQSEQTATIVWNYLSARPALPVFWNIFPFHPHKPCNPGGNRTPTAEETEFGGEILDKVVEIFGPRRILAIGKTAYDALSRFKHPLLADYIRHPANGGKAGFVAGMKSFGI